MLTFIEEIFTDIKIKNLTIEQIIISVDRLTRFKFTEDKYFRVYSDIILSNLIEPKLKKKDLETLDYSLIKDYAEYILNNSLKSLGVWCESDYYINKVLSDYENQTFKLSSKINSFLKNKINYDAVIKLFNEENLNVKNLNWLNHIQQSKTTNFAELRENYSLHYPVSKLILTEGITEEILVPKFANILGCDLDEKGIHIISAGGKNQVVKLFYFFAEIFNLPIFVLLDKDALSNYEQILPRLRKQDKLHLLSSGEFEDTLPHHLILRTINQHFKNFLEIEPSELNQDLPMVKILEEIFKTKGLHEFKKAEFAQLVKSNIFDTNDVSDEIKEIINEINSL